MQEKQWPLQENAHPRIEAPDPDAARLYLGGIFGMGSALGVERVSAGVSTYVYRVTRGAERFYLRVLPEQGNSFAGEVRVHQLLLAAGARVPEVLYYEPLSELLGGSVMLTTEVPGEPVSDQMSVDAVHAAVVAAGRDLARINAISVKGFGWVRRNSRVVPERLTAEQLTARAFMLANLDAWPATLTAVGFAPAETERLAAMIDAGRHWLDDGQGWLAHGDFDTTHIYANESGYTGIIDFGEIRGAPRLYDLAHHRMHDGEFVPYDTLPFLLDGWTSVTPLPADQWEQICYFSLLIALRSLARGLARSPDHLIVPVAVAAIRRDAAELRRLF